MDSLIKEKAGKSSSVNSESKLSTTMMPENYQWIVEAAYYKALARRFTPNRAQEDWLEAKKDYEIMLSKQQKIGLVSLRQNIRRIVFLSACLKSDKNS